jgi:hypothetical protein
MTRKTDDDEKIQVLRDTLTELPTVIKKITKRELVNRLAHTIEEAQRKGHTLRDITTYLQNNGAEITYSTLRNYLTMPRRKSKHRGELKEKAAKKPPVATVTSTEASPSPISPKKPTPKPTLPQKRVFPPGASFIPIGNGQFLPAPDSDDL